MNSINILLKGKIWLLTPLFFMGIISPLLAVSLPVSAEVAVDNDLMCIPQFNELNTDLSFETENGQDGDNRAEHHSPEGGWLEVKIVNRAQIDIKIIDTGQNCQEPDTLSMSSLASNMTPGSFAAAVNGSLFDSNLDDNFDYRNQSGDNNNDDTQIDEIYYPNDRQIDGKRFVKLTTAEITEMFRRAELIFGIEEDAVQDSLDCRRGGDDGWNFMLIRDDLYMKWRCESSILSRYTGISIANSIVTPENFNITHIVQDGGNLVKYVSSDGREENSFTWCAETEYINDGCRGNLKLLGQTKESFLTDEENSLIDVTVTDTSNGDTAEIVIAGEKSSSAVDSIPSTSGYDPTCESEGGPFSFIICPMLDWGSEVIEKVDNRIRNALEVDEKYYNDSGVKEAWGRFRNIAYILLIPVMLVMVIGTALQFSFVDAYTVKRAMPRLLIAVIFMALSYDIAIIMIEVTNVIGQGVAGLIAAPFGGSDALQLSEIFGGGGGGGLALGTGILAGVAIVGIAAAAIGLIASWLFVAALAIILIFALLTIRELIIVFLIILSPIAIISWIFPGNDKLWKMWWNSFSKLLMLYPLIIALLVTGRAFASLVDDASTDVKGFEAVFIVFVKLVAYIGPFFFIPTAFKAAGGAVGNLLGQVNDRGKGIFDRQRQYRANKRKQIGEDWRSGNLARNAGEKGLGAWINKRGMDVDNIKNRRVSYKPGELKSSLSESRKQLSSFLGEEGAKRSLAATAMQGDDDSLAAAAFETRAEQEDELVKRAPGRFDGPENKGARDAVLDTIAQAKRDMSQGTFQRWRAERQPATGTSYQYGYDTMDENGNKVRKEGVDVLQMLDELNDAYEDDGVGAGGALARMRGASVQAGQVIVGKAGYSTMAIAKSDLQKLSSNLSDGSITEAEFYAERDKIRDTVTADAFDSSTVQEMVYGKPTSAAAFGQVANKRVQAAALQIVDAEDRLRDTKDLANQGIRTPQDVKQAESSVASAKEILSGITAQMAGILDGMNHATPQNGAAFANETMTQEIQGVTLTVTQTERKQKFEPGGQPSIDGNGELIFEESQVTKKVRPKTVRELVQLMPMSDQSKAFNERRKEYGTDALQAEAGQEAAAQRGNLPGEQPGGQPGGP